MLLPNTTIAAPNKVSLETPVSNIDVSIPSAGGVAVGKHTVAFSAYSLYGFTLTISSATDNTNLQGFTGSGSANNIPTIQVPGSLVDNSWGYSIDNTIYHPITPNTRQSIVKDYYGALTTARNTVDVYFGARVDDITAKPSDTYTATVQYTVTVKPSTPIITDMTPAMYNLGDTALDSNKVTIAGTGLSATENVYIGHADSEANRCTDVTIVSDNELTCYIPTNLQPGIYALIITTPYGTATLSNAITYIKPSICRNADPDSNCTVDIDSNMIPIAYDESTKTWQVADPTALGNWYDYNNKKWANAVTVKSDKLTTYKNATPGTQIDNNDVLGYWVYIPRYAYEVMRPNAVDRVVTDTQAKSEGGFNIRFETASDIKKIPHPTCNILNPTATQMWKDGNPSNNTIDNVLAKDYRTECTKQLNFSRTYPGNTIGSSQTDKQNNTNTDTTWATHPAFTWTYPKEVYPELSINGQDKVIELNGIWVGKFETTGTRSAPTIKPNQHANIGEYIGSFYAMAKHIGNKDENNTGGNVMSGLTQNSHNMATATTHMLKNSEWGAIAYLSASKYGAGVNNVWINSANPDASADADGVSSRLGGVTGCGPGGTVSSPDEWEVYIDGAPLDATTVESETACSTTTDRSYTSGIGQLASTTNNIYGIYDMAGGSNEYAMGNRTISNAQTTSISAYMKTPTAEPYVDLYKTTDETNPFGTKPIWSISSSENYYNNEVCTWLACGGHALHETKTVQSVFSSTQSWGSDYSDFTNSSGQWFLRGGRVNNSFITGVFASYYYNGDAVNSYGYRVVALAGV